MENKAEPRLQNALLLRGYMLSLLGVETFDKLAETLRSPDLEGWDENNVSRLHHALCNNLPQDCCVTRDKLLEYDGNICRRTMHINARREDKVVWKYFQYLYLLLCEIYLDRYFSDKAALLASINRYREETFLRSNDNYTPPFTEPLTEDDLRKLSCWCATGAGKTLMMHVNMLQVAHYAQRAGVTFNNTLLITPKEALTRQHLEELERSDIMAQRFSKTAGRMMSGQYVQVMEVTKLDEKDGDKKVDVESFERNNLVFIDEGHRGTGGDTWKKNRGLLSAEGFSIEYSATFGQAIAATSNKKDKTRLLREYGASTLFDYSYRYFYHDGYGKDFRTRNMSGCFDSQQERMYLVGGLMGFYEQMRLYDDCRANLASYNIERPVAIFVGNTVTASKSKAEASDVVKTVRFFNDFVSDNQSMTACIKALLCGNDGLLDGDGHSVFGNAFAYLKEKGLTAAEIYSDMLCTIFNSGTVGARLHADNLRGQDGEIGLRLGEGNYFGVINVGDTKSVVDGCEGFAVVGVRDYQERSLFDSINDDGSHINLLIGAKKFTEGWSSWRVASMCLLNVGKGDGSEIIQLFGRGVRLKGYAFSLKRTRRLDESLRPENIPPHIETLETLNIFGIEACYMDEFSRVIKEEGVEITGNDTERITLPLMPNVNLKEKRLKYFRLKKGKSFMKEVPLIDLELDDAITKNPVVIDRYANIKTFATDDLHTTQLTTVKTEAKINKLGWQEYVDWTSIYYDILDYKRERRWYNLAVSEPTLEELIANPDWYTLYIPDSNLMVGGYKATVDMWQETITAMLKAYVERFYKIRKARWESRNYEVVTLTEEDAGLNDEVSVSIERELYQQLKEKLDRLKRQLSDKTFAETISFNKGFSAMFYNRHLYSPLLSLVNCDGDSPIKIAPVALNKSETDFVEALMAYSQTNPTELKDCELYLLRNRSKTGVGFMGDAGFYPDFILWIVKGRRQYVTFIDPHGLLHASAFSDDKINLYKTLHEEIEQKLNDKSLTLNSYILSPTPFGKVQFWGKAVDENATALETRQMFHDHHVYFMDSDGDYVAAIINETLKR